MAHVRQQIRGALKTALTGLATTGANVFVNRDQVLQETDLPALVIYARADRPDYERGQLGSIPMRVAEIVVEGVAKSTPATIDNTVDDISAEIETAIYVDQTLGGIAQGIELGETEIATNDDGDQKTGGVIQIFYVFYYAREGAPETPI